MALETVVPPLFRLNKTGKQDIFLNTHEKYTTKQKSREE